MAGAGCVVVSEGLTRLGDEGAGLSELPPSLCVAGVGAFFGGAEMGDGWRLGEGGEFAGMEGPDGDNGCAVGADVVFGT